MILLWRSYIRGGAVSILWYTVLRTLRHCIWHRDGMVDHHDVLVGLIDGGGCLRTCSDGGVTILYGGTLRLDLWPLEKLVMSRPRSSCKRRAILLLGRHCLRWLLIHQCGRGILSCGIRGL